MRFAHRALAVGLLAGAAGFLSCTDDPAEPATGGMAVVSIESPSADGAILVRLTGPGFATPEAVGSGSVLYWRQVSSSEIVVAVFGAIATGALFRVEVPDQRDLSRYQATVLQVADRNDRERTDLAGYLVTLAVAQ